MKVVTEFFKTDKEARARQKEIVEVYGYKPVLFFDANKRPGRKIFIVRPAGLRLIK